MQGSVPYLLDRVFSSCCIHVVRGEVRRMTQWKLREPEANEALKEHETQREDGDALAQLDALRFLQSCTK